MRTVAVSLFLVVLSASAHAETKAQCIASARADMKAAIKSVQATFVAAKAECKSSGEGGGGGGNTCPCSCVTSPTSCHDGDPSCDVDGVVNASVTLQCSPLCVCACTLPLPPGGCTVTFVPRR